MSDKYGFDRRLFSRGMNLSATLQKTDRILTGNPRITVRVNSGAKDTYSAGNAVTLGVKELDIFDTDDVLAVMGLNYHELAHILFTPSFEYHELIEQNNRNHNYLYLQPVFNFLEEARIETLFGATYTKAKHFFTVAVIKTLLKRYEKPAQVMDAANANHMGMTHDQSHALWVHLLTFGRKYLPVNLRDAIADYMVEQFPTPQFSAMRAKIAEAETLIDEYRMLPGSQVKKRGKQIALRMSQLFPDFFEIIASQNQSQHNPTGDNAHNSRENASSKTQQEAVEQAQQDHADGYEEVELDTTSESPQEAPEGAGGQGDTDEDGSDRPGASGGDSGASQESESQSSQGGESATGDPDEDDGQTGGGAGNTQGATGKSPRAILRKIAEQLSESIINDSHISNEVSEVMDAMDHGVERANGEYANGTRYPNGSEKETSERMAREFEKLSSEVSPGWNYGADSGRLNVSRAIDPDADPDSIWDEWEEGRETDASSEVVILVDLSGSMDDGARIYDAASFCWTITRALSEADSKITVYGFSNKGEVYTLRGRDDDSRPEMVTEFRTIGGTNPAYAINAAKELLNSSELQNRVLVVMTDGAWSINSYESGIGSSYGNQVAESYGPLLDEIHAHKTLIGIGVPETAGYFRSLAARFDVARTCTTVTDLVEPILRTVEAITREHMHH